MSQPTPMVKTPPTNQNTAKDSTIGMARGMMLGNGGHDHSYPYEVPSEHALVESDGRSVVQELPSRNLGE